MMAVCVQADDIQPGRGAEGRVPAGRVQSPPLQPTSSRYCQVTAMAKKWSKTSRLGWFASLFSGLRM